MSLIGERIFRMRKENCLTMEQLAEKLGVQKSIVSKWEKGAVENTKVKTILKMAKIFNCSPAYIIGFDFDSDCRNNGHWVRYCIPKDCNCIDLTLDRKVYERWIENGEASIQGNIESDVAFLPIYVAYTPTEDPRYLDTLAGDHPVAKLQITRPEAH